MKWTCALHHDADVPRSKKKRDLCEDCYDGLAPRMLAWCAKCKRRRQQRDMRAWGKRGTRCVWCQRAGTSPKSKSSERRAYMCAYMREYNQQATRKAARRGHQYDFYWRNAERLRAEARARYHRSRAQVEHRTLRGEL